MPNVAFGFIYGPNLNQTLNDPTYMTYQFDTISSDYVDGGLTTTKSTQKITNNCAPDWLGEYNNVYQNLTCATTQLKIMNPPLKRLKAISQRITITLCNPNSNITCQSANEISSVLSGGRFLLIINEPQGFDFQTGSITVSDYSF